MSYPDIITDKKHPCEFCGGIRFYTPSLKCVLCVRREAGIKIAAAAKRRNGEDYHEQKPTNIEKFRAKEAEIMQGVDYR